MSHGKLTYDDPPACPHGVMAGPCQSCLPWQSRCEFRINSRETEVLRLLYENEITLDKAREWLRDWIINGVIGPLTGISQPRECRKMVPCPPSLPGNKIVFDQDGNRFYATVLPHRWHHGVFVRPVDMKGAQPWQDLDGQWYWLMPPTTPSVSP